MANSEENAALKIANSPDSSLTIMSSGGAKLSPRLKASAQDLGKVDSIRYNILTLVSDEHYSRAIEQLKEFLDSKDEYPQFRGRAERYITYAVDLVNGIKAKKSFQGLQHLATAKQKELFDKAMAHFEDLQLTLRKIEQIEVEARMEDVRSTAIAVRWFSYSLTAVVVFAFLIDFLKGGPQTIVIVFGDVIDRVAAAIFKLF